MLLQHRTPEKDSINGLFYLLWEFVKERELLRKPLLEDVGVKLLSTDTEITVDLGKPNEDSPLIFFFSVTMFGSCKDVTCKKSGCKSYWI